MPITRRAFIGQRWLLAGAGLCREGWEPGPWDQVAPPRGPGLPVQVQALPLGPGAGWQPGPAQASRPAWPPDLPRYQATRQGNRLCLAQQRPGWLLFPNVWRSRSSPWDRAPHPLAPAPLASVEMGQDRNTHGIIQTPQRLRGGGSDCAQTQRCRVICGDSSRLLFLLQKKRQKSNHALEPERYEAQSACFCKCLTLG